MSLARLSVRNPVPVNLLMLATIVVGIVALARLPRELMSDVSFNWVFIAKVYPGVSAEEIERLITVPIENEIRDIKGIDTITSQSTEGSSFISVKFQQMSDDEFRARLQEIRTEVDNVSGLPEDALDTVVQSFGSDDFAPLLSVHVHGEAPEKELVELTRQLRDELLLVPKVAKAELVGVREREIWVEADPSRLRGYALSLAELQAAIGAHGINVPAGKIASGRRELLVRSVGEFTDPSQIGQVIVRAMPDDRTVVVSDVATVRDTFERARTQSRLDLAPAISVTITKNRDGNSIEIIDEVKRIARAFEQRHHGAVRVAFTQDSSEMIRDILDKLTNNAWLGFVVVVLMLLVVLGWRNALLAALGIPLSFLGCFIFMHYTGESFNSNSLFGLVLVLGIIVDDAIIIVENCYRHLQMGKSWREAAIAGTEEVTLPVLAATGTTIAAFLPLVLLPGIVGKFMRVIPITVTMALLASVIEAFLILPSHFADWPGRRLQGRADRPWFAGLQRNYVRALRYIVRRRGRFVLGLVLLVPAAGAVIPLVGQDLFAGEDINTFQVRVRMPTGTSLQGTADTMAELEAAARALPEREVRAVHATAGLVMTDTDWVFRSDVGQLWLDLSLSYDRGRSAEEIMSDMRRRAQQVAGPASIQLAKLNTGPPVGKPVEVKLKGKHLPELQQAARELETFVASIDGVRDVESDFRTGTDEVRLRVDPARAALYGLSVGQVGMTLRAAIDGAKAGSMHDGDEEIDIVVRVASPFFTRPADVLRLPLALPTGQSITVGDVATFTAEPSVAEIRRFRNQRAITISADIDKERTDIVRVNEQISAHFQGMADRFGGVNLDFGGEFQEFKETFDNIAQLFLIGLLVIYVILGAQFRSYIQPVVILFTVPFAFMGAIVGLLVSGNPFSVVTMFGMVALAGVAVNDAIVLVSFANDAQASGVPAEDAVVEAGRLRLRPILLTSATTIAGLLPMAMGVGGMSLTWGPLANTIVWGLGVATILTLFFMPAVYVIVVRDIAGRVRRWIGLAGPASR